MASDVGRTSIELSDADAAAAGAVHIRGADPRYPHHSVLLPPRGPAEAAAQASTTAKVAAALLVVEDTKIALSDSLGQVLENGENLDDLDERASAMKTQSKHFDKKAGTVRKMAWYKSWRLTVVLGVAVGVLLLATLSSFA